MAYRKNPFTGYSTTTFPPTGPTQTQCSFDWDVSRIAYAVKAQYQPNFIEFIKAKIPASDRAWDPGTKTWYIKEAWFDVMQELAQQLWPGAVSCITRATAEAAWKAQERSRLVMLKAQREAVLGPFEAALLDFCSLCDFESLKAAYRKASMTNHPDRGGDADKMSKLNATWFKIEEEFRKKETQS